MDFKLPELGEGVHEGELVKWRVKAGDAVKDDQVLCEVMTDKATMEVPSPFSGKIDALSMKEGETVKVGQTMLTYTPAGGAAKAAPAAAAAEPAPAPKGNGNGHAASPAPAMSAAPATMASLSPHDRALAAPATRKFARESGVELTRVQPSGPNGRVLREDVLRFLQGGGGTAPSRARAPMKSGGETRTPMKGLRKKIAEKMRLSKDRAAHFTYVEEADCTQLVKLREAAKGLASAEGVKITYLPFVMKAMVAALRHYPQLNASYDEEKGEIVTKHYYNIGLSVQTDDGLTAPVVHDVDQKSVIEIAREIQDKVARARANKLTMADFENSTITLTNAGSIGGLFATPVINYPEVAILGFNKIARKPVVEMRGGRERVVIRDWTYFSISLDHRVVDGAVAAEFMKRFIAYIEQPSLLVLESF